jgi:hypothetical protein
MGRAPFAGRIEPTVLKRETKLIPASMMKSKARWTFPLTMRTASPTVMIAPTTA